MISNFHDLDTFKDLLDKDAHYFAPRLCNFLCALKKNEPLWYAANEKALTEENKDHSFLNDKEAQLLGSVEFLKK